MPGLTAFTEVRACRKTQLSLVDSHGLPVIAGRPALKAALRASRLQQEINKTHRSNQAHNLERSQVRRT